MPVHDLVVVFQRLISYDQSKKGESIMGPLVVALCVACVAWLACGAIGTALHAKGMGISGRSRPASRFIPTSPRYLLHRVRTWTAGSLAGPFAFTAAGRPTVQWLKFMQRPPNPTRPRPAVLDTRSACGLAVHGGFGAANERVRDQCAPALRHSVPIRKQEDGPGALFRRETLAAGCETITAQPGVVLRL